MYMYIYIYIRTYILISHNIINITNILILYTNIKYEKAVILEVVVVRSGQTSVADKAQPVT